MSKMTETSTLVQKIQEEHVEILRTVDQLDEAVTGLQYEGKVSSGKNIKRIEASIEYFNASVLTHVRLEEDVVFKFLAEHMPSLEPMICFLRSDHKEFRDTLRAFQVLFEEVKKEKNDLVRPVLMEKMRFKGIYLVCIMRTHIQAENESIVKTIAEKLHKGEVSALEHACEDYAI